MWWDWVGLSNDGFTDEGSHVVTDHPPVSFFVLGDGVLGFSDDIVLVGKDILSDVLGESFWVGKLLVNPSHDTVLVQVNICEGKRAGMLEGWDNLEHLDEFFCGLFTFEMVDIFEDKLSFLEFETRVFDACGKVLDLSSHGSEDETLDERDWSVLVDCNSLHVCGGGVKNLVHTLL